MGGGGQWRMTCAARRGNASGFVSARVFFPECVAKGSRLTLGVWG